MNPYEAPQSSAASAELPQAEAVPESLPLKPARPERWGPVFVFNLPAVLVYGVYVNQVPSFIAMIAACVVLFLVSLYFVRQSALAARRLIAGGKVVAVSQILPLLHLLLGKLAYEFLFALDPRLMLGGAVQGAFYLTLLVGCGLLAAAYVWGANMTEPWQPAAQTDGKP